MCVAAVFPLPVGMGGVGYSTNGKGKDWRTGVALFIRSETSGVGFSYARRIFTRSCENARRKVAVPRTARCMLKMKMP